MTSAEYLGPYRVGELIGRGGMGSVHEAENVSTGERVAIKLIANHVADEMRFRRRFAAEVETLKRLRHPNIVRLIGYGEEKGQLFYSMELVKGESIQKVLRRQKKLPWIRVVDIGIQICSALKHAHDIGVIHRDLKPANLILSESGQIKLVDFGIAKLFGFGEQTMAGSVLGTADYMAPEQADGQPITTRTDLYALGSVMFAMLAGRAPFADKNVTRVMESLRNERPVSLTLIDPEIPEDVVELVNHLLEKKYENRPPTALSVGNRLRAMKTGLLRERTLNETDEATAVGSLREQLTSVTSAPAAEARPTPGDPRHAGDTASADQRAKRGKTAPGAEQADSSETSSTDPGPATDVSESPVQRAGPADITLASAKQEATFKHADSPLQEQTPESDSASQHQETHFQTVDQHDRSYTGAGTSTDATGGWTQLLSIGSMVAILMAGTWLFWRSIQTPSSDELYQQILAAERNDRLASVEPEMRLFLQAYADDGRTQIVHTLQDKLELDRLLKRLKLKSKQTDGVDHLPPHEQAFYRAMNARQESPDQASEQLRDWLAVFQQPGTVVEPEIEAMARMARAELARLAGRSPIAKTDSRIEELMQRIQSTRTLPPEERRQTLESLIKLYEGREWAEGVIQRARDAIEATQASVSSTSAAGSASTARPTSTAEPDSDTETASDGGPAIDDGPEE